MADKGKKDKGGDKGDKGGKKGGGDKGGGDKKEEKKDDKKAEKGAKGDKAAAAPKGDKGDKGKGDKADKGDKGGDKGDKAADKGDKKEKKEEKKTEKKATTAPSTDKPTAVAGGDDTEAPKKRGPFRRFFYRGHEVPTLLDLSHAELMKLMTARARRRFARGHVPMNLIRRLRKAKKDAPEGEKPKTVKTHLRNMIIVPEMVASIVGVYNGQSFTQVEIKPDMIGHYLGEFSISYKPVKHGRPGVGATNSSRFIPLK
jgi:small subunit ribosomal protein S15e